MRTLLKLRWSDFDFTTISRSIGDEILCRQFYNYNYCTCHHVTRRQNCSAFWVTDYVTVRFTWFIANIVVWIQFTNLLLFQDFHDLPSLNLRTFTNEITRFWMLSTDEVSTCQGRSATVGTSRRFYVTNWHVTSNGGKRRLYICCRYH